MSDLIGVKYDQGKLRWTLLPWRTLKGVVEILEMGAKKYAEDNWKKVEPQRYKDAALRHLTDWLSGEKTDFESGKSHLYHCICCLLFLAWFEEENEINSN